MKTLQKARQYAACSVLVILCFLGRSIAGSDGLCRPYATNAVQQFEDVTRLNCNIPNGPRWQANFGNHYSWCMSASDDSVRNEEQIRSSLLSLCKQEEKALMCDQYAREALKQIKTAQATPPCRAFMDAKAKSP